VRDVRLVSQHAGGENSFLTSVECDMTVFLKLGSVNALDALGIHTSQ
jgi:hypothetical protein